ncbi:MAG: hypothetical protein ABJA98_02470 [Acidobacteriota bacterium]
MSKKFILGQADLRMIVPIALLVAAAAVLSAQTLQVPSVLVPYPGYGVWASWAK